jgi:NADP-dependent 3-hydroxy acid dehydrogenase YdfG
MINAVLPFMRQQKRGHIINVSSLTGLSAIPFLGIYSASKFALEGYTEALTARSQTLQYSRIADRGGLSQDANDEQPASGSQSNYRV